MVKIAILSDIHSNIFALEAVLKDIKKKKNIKEIICLGDIVGYYAYPNECIELIRDNCSITVLGNHDAGVIGQESAFFFNPTAYEMVVWTKENLTQDNYNWLTTLPRKKTIERGGKSIYLVHGSPLRTFDYFDAFSEDQWSSMLEKAFEITGTDLLMVGHTHIPFKFKYGKKYFVNPGSVGQTRNGVPGAYYAILNTNPISITMEHLNYDFSPLQNRMKELGLPESLSERLNHGF